MRVIVLDQIADEGLRALEAAEIPFEVRTGLKGDQLRAALAEFEGAICRSGVKITAESLEGNRRLKAIVRAGVGTDNIDKEAATRHGIVVMNTPAGNTISTAELTFTLLLALSRNVAPAFASLQRGQWDRKSYMGAQLAGKTLGIVGMGRIGQEVAKRAQAFQMRVLGYDPFLSAEQAAKLGIERRERVDDMLPELDYLTVHTPLTAETRHLIGAAQLERLKPGARLVNCARGGIYDEAALLEGLNSGRLAGVALDVYEHEPCTDSPLFQHPHVICTPHLGASTEEAQTLVAEEAVALLVNFLKRGEIRHSVNMSPIDPQTLGELRGFLNLAYRLGLLMGQWQGAGASACDLRYRGEVAGQDTRLLTAAFCAGLLERALDEPVNIVNAEVLLRDRGIHLSHQSIREMGAFSSSMTVELRAGERRTVVAGTLFGTEMPRLIRVGDYRLESYLDGTLLIFTHEDVPGIIGAVGTIFGKHEVNIAQMSVGRATAAPGGSAVGILQLDSPPPTAALEEVKQIPHIGSVHVIEMPPAGALPAWLQ